jgi:TrmH family RNA methyltransferase
VKGGGTDWRGLRADILRAETPRGRARLDCFAIEGTRVHERALRAGAPLEAVLRAESFGDDPSGRNGRLVKELEAAACRCEIAPDSVLGELIAGRGTGAIVGLVRLPAPRSLSELLRAHPANRPTLLVGIDVEDPGNIGALVRTALASGAAAFAGVGAGDAFHPRAVRTSMGSLFKLPVLHFSSVAPLLAALDRDGLMKVGAVPTAGRPLPGMRFGDGGVAVFVGGEAHGLSGELRAAMDALATVPMAPGVDSFSVNAAAAVILYEIRRAGA